MNQPTFALPTEHFSTLDLFPSVYGTKALGFQDSYVKAEEHYMLGKNDSDTNCRRYELWNQHISNRNNLESQKKKLADKRDRRNRGKTGGIIGFVAGLWIGLFAILSMGFAGVLVWVALIVVGYLIGRGIDKNYDKKIKQMDQVIAREEADSEARYNAEVQASHERCDKSKKDVQKSIADYRAAFDAAAKEQSLKYVESALITTISKWLADNLSTFIDRADRASHKEIIEAQLLFFVYRQFVMGGICDEKTKEATPVHFIFQENRCPDLDSPLQISGVARALAQQLQVELWGRYPEDPVSGTPVTIEIKSEKTEVDHASETLGYAAVNTAYKALQEW